ncbi:MAG: 4-hydroxy-tetrahydrodipicolinate synthase [Candidatus Thorarchaeota archaeon AB_25]|nr:MAG: 4-hydroxy-tetrahydrodipicolinate synthase [Candidatus Thorarchaeota archaeon AB_25]
MPALVTPFTRDGDISEDGYRQVIDYTIDKGATGVVALGTTGEFSYLRTEERKKMLKLTLEYVDGRVPIIAGTGQHSTRATVDLTKYAADVGCDAALVISPYYLRPADKGYYEHYEEVARKGDLPVLMYNIPQCTLGVLNSNVVEDLAELDNIVGIKDSSGSVPYVLELIQKLKGKMEVIIGADECFLSAVVAGSKAAIMASANVIPHIWLEIMKLAQSGKVEEAAKLQRSTQTFARMVLKYGAAPPVKAALKMLGVNAGRSRMPLNSGGTLTPESKEEVRIELEKMGVIDKLEHPAVQKDIQIIDFLKRQGITIGHSAELMTSNAANDMVSVGIVAGPKTGSIGHAFVRLLTIPKIGHEALTVILEPNLSVKPSSLMLPTRKIQSMRQASFFYGPVQSGAAKAIATFLEAGKIPKKALAEDLAILALDIDLNARDRREITAATQQAVESALAGIWR